MCRHFWSGAQSFLHEFGKSRFHCLWYNLTVGGNPRIEYLNITQAKSWEFGCCHEPRKAALVRRLQLHAFTYHEISKICTLQTLGLVFTSLVVRAAVCFSDLHSNNWSYNISGSRTGSYSLLAILHDRRSVGPWAAMEHHGFRSTQKNMLGWCGPPKMSSLVLKKLTLKAFWEIFRHSSQSVAAIICIF